MFETINEFWLDLLNNCKWEKSHSEYMPSMQVCRMLRGLEGCKIVVYRRSNTKRTNKILGDFEIPNLIDMPKFRPPIIEKLQLLAEWFHNEIDSCYRVDVQYLNNNASYIESDKLPGE